ncbi:hypothetical protein D3C76_1468620 [compost metagenome]
MLVVGAEQGRIAVEVQPAIYTEDRNTSVLSAGEFSTQKFGVIRSSVVQAGLDIGFSFAIQIKIVVRIYIL